ncbi:MULTISPECIES: hypothetical protein [unclassified Streptomyces]|uniref:hypothetical protein n=1 Tax=unclassified Streptomyces TaxID=2593676 RepID=UPI00117FE777|nr:MULTISPECIES: hypothetical protein [unclassified Streptomyces]
MSYARTSEAFRQRDGHGVRHQLRINERTAGEHGCLIVAAYTDNGRSARREMRQGLVSTPWLPRCRPDARPVVKRSKVSFASRTIGCIAARRTLPGSSPR